MKVTELRAALRKLGLPATGDKQTLEKRLEEAERKGSEGELVRGPEGAMRERMKQVRLREGTGLVQHRVVRVVELPVLLRVRLLTPPFLLLCPSPSLFHSSSQMFEEGTFSDITISIPGTGDEPGQELELHRNVLAHSCEYFRGMLTREFRESGEETVEVQVAANSSVSATASVLEYLYTSEVKVDGENVFEVLSAADKLQLEHLRKSCVGYLERSLCPTNVCSVLKACQALSLVELEARCSKVIEENGKAVLESGGLNELEKAAVVAIISNEKLTAKEEEVFEAVASWGEARKGGGTAAAAVAGLIPHIRFEEMEHAFLHQRVRQSGLVPLEVLLDAMTKIIDDKTSKYEPGTKRAFESGSGSGTGRPKKRRRG